jgi:hypothetical protein
MTHIKKTQARLPLAHPTFTTWVTLGAIAVVIALFAMWMVWFAEPRLLP